MINAHLYIPAKAPGQRRGAVERTYSKRRFFTKGGIMAANIEGKVVVITGASSGLGESTARLLAASGAKVVLGASSPRLPVALAFALPPRSMLPVLPQVFAAVPM